MRTQDIKIGEFYRRRSEPTLGYCKAIKIIKPMAEYKKKSSDLTEDEKKLKVTAVKCEVTQYKNDTFGRIGYFRPCDLIKCE